MSAIGLAVLGALIAGRRLGNPIGWLMSVGALFFGVFSFTQQYAPLAVAESLPGVDLASWLAAATPTCSGTSCWPWSTRRSSRPGPRSGCGRPRHDIRS